jgi:hypothetical protein
VDIQHIRDSTSNNLTRRWSLLMIRTWSIKIVIISVYAFGAFVLGMLSQTEGNHLIAVASVFLLASVCAVGLLADAYWQELATSVQEFHCDSVMAVSHLIVSHGTKDEDVRRSLRDQYQAMALGFVDAASGRDVSDFSVLTGVCWRLLIFVIPPLAGWIVG